MDMRSDWLQEKYSSDYQQFFAQHDLVVSVPHVFRWGHSIARGKNVVSIKQKLPASIYAGVVRKREQGVTIQKITCLDQNKGVYTTQDMVHVVPDIDQREKFMEELLKKLGSTGGVEIDIYTEYPRGNGLGFVGTMSALLALVALLVTDHISPEDLDDYEQFAGSSYFRFAVVLALMMNATCTNKRPGLQGYVCLAPGGDPIMRLNKIEISNEWKQLHRSTDMFETFLQLEDKIQKKLIDQFLSFKDFAKLPPQVHATPFDYSILYLGLPHETTRIYRSYAGFHKLFAQVAEYMEERKTDLGVNDAQEQETLNLDNLSYFFAAHLLQRRQQFTTHPYDNSYRQGFLQAINDNGMYHGLIERENSMLIEVPSLFAQLSTMSDESIGVMPISTAKAGGCLLCVTPYQQSHKTMNALLVELQKTYPDACFHYQSWRDGTTAKGVTIHQYLSKDVYSSYVKSGNVAVMFADGKTSIMHHADINQLDYTGVMLDTLARKLYINGEKVTHRDLVSQSGTVELFDYLLDRIGEYVVHSELPPSSYTRNKNEMVGKIITPFKELIKKKFGTDLQIICTGTTYEFQLCLQDDGGLLHVIKKLGSV